MTCLPEQGTNVLALIFQCKVCGRPNQFRQHLESSEPGRLRDATGDFFQIPCSEDSPDIHQVLAALVSELQIISSQVDSPVAVGSLITVSHREAAEPRAPGNASATREAQSSVSVSTTCRGRRTRRAARTRAPIRFLCHKKTHSAPPSWPLRRWLPERTRTSTLNRSTPQHIFSIPQMNGPSLLEQNALLPPTPVLLRRVPSTAKGNLA